MRFVVLLSFVLVLGVLSSDLKVTDSVSSFLASKHENVKVADNNNFVIHWSNEKVDGYRLASFDDITTQAFVDEYNSPGIYLNIDAVKLSPDLQCTLTVTDGVLLYPKNDTENASLMTPGDHYSNYGCGYYGESGHVYFVTWPYSLCISPYTANEFPNLTVSFMKKNFFTKSEYCQTGANTTNFAIFIRDSTPSSSFTPTPPSSTPSSSYVCCGYYDFSAQFETAFCQVSGQKCPNSIGSYTGVGNFTVSDCKDCCNKIYTKK